MNIYETFVSILEKDMWKAPQFFFLNAIKREAPFSIHIEPLDRGQIH